MPHQQPPGQPQGLADTPGQASPGTELTESEWAALREYRDARAAELQATQAEALMRIQRERDAERRVHAAAVKAMTDQISELVVRQREADKRTRETDRRLREAERQLSDVTRGVGENTEILKDVRDLLAAFKSGFKVLGWLGTGAKWAGALAAAGVSIYTVIYMATHGGHPPGK